MSTLRQTQSLSRTRYGSERGIFSVTTTMRQCVPSAISSRPQVFHKNKKPIPMEGRVDSVVPPCFVIRPPGRKTSLRHASSYWSRDAPGTDNGCPLRPRLRPNYKGFGWRLPGPFGLCVRAGSHLTRFSERRRRPTTPVRCLCVFG